MITCKRATELISESMEQPLSAAERVALQAHLLICGLCRSFRKNLKALRCALSGSAPEVLADDPLTDVPPGAKERLKALLRKKQGS